MKAKLATCFSLAATMLVATTASADKLPDPPSASIISPTDGEMFEGAPAVIAVECDVAFGTGLDNIELFVDEVSAGQVTAAPWTFADVELAEGMHALYVVANGSDGIGYPSPTINVAVVAGGGETGGESGEDGTGTGGGSGGESSGGGTSSEGAEDDGGSKGCSTTTTGGIGLLGLGLFGLAALGLSRRRP